jgi:hypothetical protein
MLIIIQLNDKSSPFNEQEFCLRRSQQAANDTTMSQLNPIPKSNSLICTASCEQQDYRQLTQDDAL